MRLAVGLLLLSSACAPPWAVLRRSGPPSALRGATGVEVAVSYEELEIEGRDLEAHLASLSETEQTAFREALEAMAQAFRDELESSLELPVVPMDGPLTEGKVRVTAHFGNLRPGRFAVMVAIPTELTTRLQWTLGTQEVDAIETLVRIPADLTRPATIQRMRIAGANTARHTAQFFEREQERR